MFSKRGQVPTQQQNTGAKTSMVSTKTPARRELTREELIAQDGATTQTSLEIKEESEKIDQRTGQTLSRAIIVSDRITKKKVAHIDIGKAVAAVRAEPEPEYITPIVVNDLSREVYVAVGFAGLGSSRQIFPKGSLYAISFDGGIRELVTIYGQTTYDRLAPDRTSYSFVSLQEAAGNQAHTTLEAERLPVKSKRTLTIIDLLSDEVVTFPTPGDAMTFALAHKNQFKYPGAVLNFIAAYRFPDADTIEFTRYYSYLDDSTKIAAENQVSDKELWSYNKKTGKLTLIETIPFKKTQ